MKAHPVIIALIVYAVTMGAQQYDVTSFGAVGDAVSLDTAAIQRTIDACADGGGGKVVFPKGVYLSGSIVLKSKVTLLVTPEATLLGSKNIQDYSTGRLLQANGASDITIEGGGTIDGQGDSFWVKKDKEYVGEPWHGTAQFNYTAQKRPSFIHLLRSTNIIIRNITLTNSASWTVHMQRCMNVLAENVTIRNFLYGPNTDGFDVNSCVDVTIRGCDIITGDDGIVLKSTEPGHDHPSRNILAERCRIWSACNGLKIGTETHDSFENIVFRDIHLYSDTDIALDRTLAGVAIESVDGSHLSGIFVSNITMSNMKAPIFIRLGHRGRDQVAPKVPGKIENVVMKNITAKRSMFTSSITGIPGYSVGNGISLSGITLEYEGGEGTGSVRRDVPDKECVAKYPEAQMFGQLPAYGLYIRHAKGISVSDMYLSYLEADARPAIILDDVRASTIERAAARSSTGEHPFIWAIDSREITVRGCSAPPGVKTFVTVEGDGASAAMVTLTDNRIPAGVTPLAVRSAEDVLAELPLFTERSRGVVVIDPTRMKIVAPMTVNRDPSFPTACIETPAAKARDAGFAQCRFTVSEDGEYVIRVRAFSARGEEDTFYASVDGGEISVSDVLKKGEWAWDFVRSRVNDKTVPEARTTYRLTKGTHILKIQNRESGTKIGTIVVMEKDAVCELNGL
ncbi:MAG: glycosyl hydrolase family 28 protein [Spirochaetota bacterium]